MSSAVLLEARCVRVAGLHRRDHIAGWGDGIAAAVEHALCSSLKSALSTLHRRLQSALQEIQRSNPAAIGILRVSLTHAVGLNVFYE
jgi:hypothetical protein